MGWLTYGAGGNCSVPLLLLAATYAFQAAGVTASRCDLPFRLLFRLRNAAGRLVTFGPRNRDFLFLRRGMGMDSTVRIANPCIQKSKTSAWACGVPDFNWLSYAKHTCESRCSPQRAVIPQVW
jgi:hypothetical protein